MILSLCIPTYNRAARLHDTLKQLQFVLQWDLPVEILIGNNGSTDGSAEVISAMQQTLPMIQAFHYPHNIGMERCLASLLRTARGRYVLYLADDDQLIAERLLSGLLFMEHHPDVVAYYAPVESWHVGSQTSLGNSFAIDQPRQFTAADPLQLFRFITTSVAMPDRVLFRTEVLARVCFNSHKGYAPLIWLAQVLAYGTLHVATRPFYRWGVGYNTTLVQNPGSFSLSVNLDRRDAIQGGLNLALFVLLRLLQRTTVISKEDQGAFLEGINAFMIQSLPTLTQFLFRFRDYISAMEFARQYTVWRCDEGGTIGRELKLADLDGHYATVMALHAISHLVSNLPGTGRLVLCQVAGDAPVISRVLQQMIPQIVLTEETVAQILASNDYDDQIVITHGADVREQLLAGGMAPGSVIHFPDWQRHFKVGA
ncbi:MAG: glycosyltransferase family 2 protein [Magnetococcales bacterium]|nr:glycosyltransferase family 2 protein [Magnetococcales bacterium]